MWWGQRVGVDTPIAAHTLVFTLAVNQPVVRPDRRCWCGKRQQRDGDGSDGGEKRSTSRNVIVASLVEVGVVTPPLWGRPLWTPRRHCSH